MKNYTPEITKLTNSVLAHKAMQISDQDTQDAAQSSKGAREVVRSMLSHVVKELKRIFTADAATLFIKEFDRIYLAKSTDEMVYGENPNAKTAAVYYEPNQGLTGSIFSSRQSFRTHNSLDKENMQKFCQSRSGPTFSESCTLSASKVAFLGIPMRVGNKAEGVIRLLRAKHKASVKNLIPFSSQEKESLQFFVDVFALVIRHLRYHFLNSAIIEAEAEADIISRQDPKNKANGNYPVIVSADAGARKLFGASSTNDLKSTDARKLYADGEYKDVAARLLTAINKKEKELVFDSLKMKRQDGTAVWGHASYRLVSSPFAETPANYTIGVIIDITESQAKADQHRRILELLRKKRIAYFRTDRAGQTVESSPAEEVLLGYTEEELKNMPREQIYKDPAERNRLLKRLTDSPDSFVHSRQRLVKKHSEVFWAEGDFRIIVDSKGNQQGIEGLYEDITDRIQLEHYLDIAPEKSLRAHELYEKLERSESLQLNFITSFGHQLKTPLGALTQTLVNIKEDVIGERKSEKRLKYAMAQANLCALLSTGLNYIDRVLREEHFDIELVALGELVTETHKSFKHLFEVRKLQIKLENIRAMNKDLALWVNQDLIRQVLLNLFDNAVKYSKKGSTVELRSFRNNDVRVFEIVNQGLQVPKDQREKIFERGYRLPNARHYIPHGTGLGLWLVRKIVEAHRGARIECLGEGEVVHSEGKRIDNRKTVFRITFPESMARIETARKHPVGLSS